MTKALFRGPELEAVLAKITGSVDRKALLRKESWGEGMANWGGRDADGCDRGRSRSRNAAPRRGGQAGAEGFNSAKMMTPAPV